MKIIKNLVRYKELSIYVELKNEKLLIKSKQESITDEIKAELKKEKGAILSCYKELGIISNKQLAPSSFSQQRLWFIDTMLEGSSNYNMVSCLPIREIVDINAINKSLSDLIERHHSLRTNYIESEGIVYQVINEPVAASIELHDFKTFPQQLAHKKVQSVVDASAGHVFNLSKGKILKVDLCYVKENESYLIVNIHHIASDGWSQDIFKKEFLHFYIYYTSNKGRPLPELNYQFADYAHWERNFFRGEVLSKHLQYWENKLQNIPDVHSLALDRPRPTIQTYNGSEYSTMMNEDDISRFKTICVNSNASLFMGLSATFAYLLSRFSGEDDIVFSTPIANREQLEMSEVIGFFVNTLVLRFDLSSVNSFEDLLMQAKEICIGAYAHQQMPLEQIVEKLKIKRSTSYSPVFQIMFSTHIEQEANNFDYNSTQYTGMPGVKVTRSKFDLSVQCQVTERGHSMSWSYNSDLFDHSSIELMSDCYNNLMCQIVEKPRDKLSSFYLKKHEAQTDNSTTLNRIVSEAEELAHELLEYHALKFPNNIALSFDGVTTTFGTFNSKANKLAHYLKRLGIQPNDPVAVYMDSSDLLAIGIFAVLKSGGCYVAIDKKQPQKRVEHIVAKVNAHLLLTDEKVGFEFDRDVKVVNIASNDTLVKIDEERDNNLNLEIPDSNIAYIAFTSGSSGEPKGVVVSQKNLRAYLSAINKHYNITPVDNVLQFSSISFDIFVEELFCSICNGATLQIRGASVNTDIIELSKFIKANETSVISLPTAYFHLLCENIVAIESEYFDVLRLIIVGGEKLSAEMVKKWHSIFSNRIKLLNTYGPTEVTVVSTVYNLDEFNLEGSNIPIGKPLDGLKCYIVDRFGHICPQGMKGELYIAGDLVAVGYLNNHKLNTQKFVTISGLKDDRFYKTGDLAKYLPDGNIEFIGRIDDQIKVRGFRIEPGEIEHQVSQLEGVDSVLVEAKASGPDNQLVVYVKPVANCETHAEAMLEEQKAELVVEIKARLSESLPDYMVPSAFVVIDDWPLTLLGKVDKKALPVPDFSHLSGGYEAPESETEKALVAIWSKLLKLKKDNVSINANFFELGGHSLLAVRLVADIRAKLQQELAVKIIFESSTIRSLAKRIDAGFNTLLRTPVTSKKRQPGKPVIASFAQQRLWFIDQQQGGSAEYNMPFALQVEGDFDPAVAERAITRIIARHESLRTVFKTEDDEIRQVIQSNFQFKLVHHDLTQLDETAQTCKVESLVLDDSLKPFDLSRDLMVRVTYLLLSDSNEFGQGILLINMHHIASDGWSTGILLKEFITQYQSIIEGKSDPLPSLEIQYADYALWQRQWLSDEVLDAQLKYWKKQLCGVPAVHSLPLKNRRPEMKLHQGALVTSQLSADVSERLQQIAKLHQLTPFMLFQAALALVLSRHSNSQDIVMGTPVANRLQAELEPLIGFFVNMLVLRVDTKYESLTDYLAHIRTINLDAQSHQDIPFEQLVEHCNVPRSTQHSPLFQILFTMDTNEHSELAIPGVRFKPLDGKEIVAKFDLEISAQESEEGIDFFWVYDTSLFTQAQIEILSKHLNRLLIGIAERPESNLCDLSMLSVREIHHLTHVMNDVQANYPKDKCIHELFEEYAELLPDKIAVIFEEKQLTYRELNEQANQLAHYLREQGVERESLVGIYAERSLELIISILAILKAGGAYVPLDPSYPELRIKSILSDSGIKYVLAQRELMTALKFEQASVFAVDERMFSRLLQNYSTENINSSVSGYTSSQLAYVIYTSGSTGQPKGVMIEHSSIVRLVADLNYIENDEPLVVLQAASISFDAATFEIWSALSSAGRLVIMPSGKLDLERLNVTIEDNSVNTLWLTSALFDLWVDTRGIFISSLRTVLAGGDIVLPSSVEKLYKENQKVVFVNGYGPTENTTFTTTHKVSRDKTALSSSTIPIGHAINATCCYVLDKEERLTPYGVPGELYIGGPGLARGYLNQTELTAEKFVKNPFSTDSGERLYRTGDLVRYLPDGSLDFIGRVDNQVKIRGFRIELGEIDYQLSRCEKVNSSLIVVSENGAGDKCLIAYVVLENNEQVVESEFTEQLRQNLQQSLPDYMVPSMFAVIDEWPLTPNGKIDKKALPKLDGKRQVKYIAPTTATERALCKVWQQVLKVEKVGVTDNFFYLGGHSLLMFKLLRETRENCGVELQILDLINHPYIRELAKIVDSSASDSMRSLSINQSNKFQKFSHINDFFPTLYCVPGAGGLGLIFGHLAKQASRYFNVKAFHYQGLLDDNRPHNTMTELVDYFLDALLLEQPTGPYFLVGHSFGGMVAHELVHRLNAKGLEAKLILIDSRMFIDSLSGEQRIKSTQQIATMKSLLGTREAQLFLKDVDGQTLDKMKMLFEVHVRLMKEHCPSHKIESSILNIHTPESSAWVNHREYAERLQSLTACKVINHCIEGGHYSILMEKGSADIVDAIREYYILKPIKH
ncbi:non-ribosomal peptide synthetase [Aliikangiella coralliicola]|uniref:Amino acid adenylation domain-containing protein n=1 Tax=Aliikangiella coralliicola TaxID=2592383 RepID=A0A545TV53_9GAMM|nr:non-ribosomal peptide synthetase [Aliikangiella coralliicola]TQV81105.1 amino acid adenylation domain-containing protein [Aliikangiella coralliicola]